MSNRKSEVLIKYLHTLSQVGFNKSDEKVQNVINEIEKELEIQKKPKLINYLAKNPNKALVVAIKDNSGSVGVWEKRVFKEYYDLAIKETKDKYSDVEEMFINFHTEAKQVTKENFYTDAATGGTIVSSGIRELNKLLNTDREVIVIQMSDGDNLTSDNARVLSKLNDDIFPNVKYFKYVEANQYNRHSTLMSAYKNITNSKFSYVIIKQNDDALKGIRFGEELESLQ